VNGLSWAPPELGLHLATASSDGKVVVLSHRESDDGWDVAPLEDSTLGTLAVSWAPAVGGGARYLATAGCDGSVNVWGCEGGGGKWSKRGGALKCCPSGEAVWVRDVAWCPMEGVGGGGEGGEGAAAAAAAAAAMPPLLLAAATDAGVVHLFRTKGGSSSSTGGASTLEWEAPITLPKFNSTVWRVSWSATGRLLAVSSGDNTVTLWKEDVSRTWQQVCNAPVNSQ
jgi:protein transport protein SEC13